MESHGSAGLSGLQCLSAVGPMRTGAAYAFYAICRFKVSSAFRRWVLCGPEAPDRRANDSGRVSSAFRRWVLCGLDGHHRLQAVVESGLQCLSAVGPMRTFDLVESRALYCFTSPVPFGGGSYADARRSKVSLSTMAGSLQCLSAVGPMRTIMTAASSLSARGKVSSAFRRWVLCGQRHTMDYLTIPLKQSPVPFGGGSYADQPRNVARPRRGLVSSAFRRWVLCGLAGFADAVGMEFPSLQCLSAVGPMRTGERT